MPTLSINIPAGVAARVEDAVAQVHGFTGLDPQGQAETKAQFLKRQVILFLKATIKAAEAVPAATTARRNAEQAVDSEIILS